MKSSNNKILTIAVVLLLLTNIALVIFMVRGKGDAKRPGGRGNSDMMAKELNMSEEQKKEHKRLKDEHLKNVKPLSDSIRAPKTALYSMLKDSTVSDSTVNFYSQLIGEKQTAIEKLTFAHFKRKRNMFTAEQQPKFDSFVLKMMQGGRRDSTVKKEK